MKVSKYIVVERAAQEPATCVMKDATIFPPASCAARLNDLTLEVERLTGENDRLRKFGVTVADQLDECRSELAGLILEQGDCRE